MSLLSTIDSEMRRSHHGALGMMANLHHGKIGTRGTHRDGGMVQTAKPTVLVPSGGNIPLYLYQLLPLPRASVTVNASSQLYGCRSQAGRWSVQVRVSSKTRVVTVDSHSLCWQGNMVVFRDMLSFLRFSLEYNDGQDSSY